MATAKVRATRGSWKNLKPMPPTKARVPLERTFTREEHERLSFGLVPEQMEDHWFAFLEGDTLWVHRSWTGICRYEVKLAAEGDGYRVDAAYSNRMPPGEKDDLDAALLRYLIERVMGNDWPFPG